MVGFQRPDGQSSSKFRALRRPAATGCIAVLLLMACEGQGSAKLEPEVAQGKPAAERAAAQPAASSTAPASPSSGGAPGPVGVAKYQESGKPGSDSPASAAAGTPSPSTASAPLERAAAPTAAGSSPAAAAPVTPPAKGTPAEPLAQAGEPRQGAVVNEEAFSVWLQAKAPIGVGSPAELEAVLVAKAPYHCNAEYPHKFKFSAAPAGLSYPEEVVRGMAVTAERSVLRMPVLAKTAGPATVSGTLSFSVCTDERCLVEKRDLSLPLEVK